MAGVDEAEEWVGDDGVEVEERWPEDRRTPDTKLSTASTPSSGGPWLRRL